MSKIMRDAILQRPREPMFSQRHYEEVAACLCRLASRCNDVSGLTPAFTEFFMDIAREQFADMFGLDNKKFKQALFFHAARQYVADQNSRRGSKLSHRAWDTKEPTNDPSSNDTTAQTCVSGATDSVGRSERSLGQVEPDSSRPAPKSRGGRRGNYCDSNAAGNFASPIVSDTKGELGHDDDSNNNGC